MQWLPAAEAMPAPGGLIRQVLDLGQRCADAGCLADPLWRAMVATEAKGPHTINALRDLLAALYLRTADRSPKLAEELRKQDARLAALLSVCT